MRRGVAAATVAQCLALALAAAGMLTGLPATAAAAGQAATTLLRAARSGDPAPLEKLSATTRADTPVWIDVLAANDSDAGSVPVAAEPDVGTAGVDGDLIRYTPEPGFRGTAHLRYTIGGGEGAIEILVRLPWPSTAIDDAVAVGRNDGSTAAPGRRIEVLRNDRHPEPRTTVRLRRAPEHGRATVLRGGAIGYLPDPKFEGSDSFTYALLVRGTIRDVATVRVQVLPRGVLNAVFATAVQDHVLADSRAVVRVPVIENDARPLVLRGPLAVSNAWAGTVRAEGEVAEYQRADSQTCGSDWFFYALPWLGRVDNPDQEPFLEPFAFTAPLLKAPVHVALDCPMVTDDPVDTERGSPVTVAVLNNDGGLAKGRVRLADSLDGGAEFRTRHGRVTLDGNSVHYQPDPDFSGVDHFRYSVLSQDRLVGPATVVVHVAGPQAVDDEASTWAGHPVTIPVLQNDVRAAGLDVAAPAKTKGGTVVVNDNTLAYTPDDGFAAVDTFRYRLTSREGTTLGTAQVRVTVKAVQVQPDRVSPVHGQPITADVLANDSVPPTARVRLDPAPTKGSATVTDDGRRLLYTPAGGTTQPDTFGYVVTDPTLGRELGRAAVTVSPVGAVDDTAVSQFGRPVDLDVLANDIGAAGLTVSLVDDPIGGTLRRRGNGTFTFAPAEGFVGDGGFTYALIDRTGAVDSARVTVTVPPRPRAVDDSFDSGSDPIILDVLGNDVGARGLRPELAQTPAAQHGSAEVTPDGTIRYAPARGFSGTDTFRYRLTDGSTVFSTASVTLQVTGAPVAGDDRAGTLTGTAVAIPVLQNDLNTTGLVPVLAPGLQKPGHGQVTVGSDGRLTYTPVPDFVGTDSFQYGLGSTDTVTDTARVTVAVRARPRAVDDTAGTDGGAPLLLDVLANDVDADGLRPQLTSRRTAHAALDVTSDGRIRYTVATGFQGTDSFTYVLADSGNVYGSARVVVNVRTGPRAVDDRATATDGRPVRIPVLVNDLNVDGLGVSLLGGARRPTHGSAAVQPDGSVLYTPVPGFGGTEVFEYRLSRGSRLLDTGRVTVAVTAAPRARAAVDALRVRPGTAGKVDVLANDRPIGPVTAALVSGPKHGTATLTPAGVLTYTASAGYVGADTVGYALRSAGRTVAGARVDIRVVRPDEGTGKVTVRPAGGPPDRAVQVTGSGCVSSDQVTVLVDGRVAARPSPRPDGGFSARVRAPARTGRHTVTARCGKVPLPPTALDVVLVDAAGQAVSAPATATVTVTSAMLLFFLLSGGLFTPRPSTREGREEHATERDPATPDDGPPAG